MIDVFISISLSINYFCNNCLFVWALNFLKRFCYNLKKKKKKIHKTTNTLYFENGSSIFIINYSFIYIHCIFWWKKEKQKQIERIRNWNSLNNRFVDELKNWKRNKEQRRRRRKRSCLHGIIMGFMSTEYSKQCSMFILQWLWHSSCC